MVSLTLSIPMELREKMAQHPEIKWSKVVRAILTQQIEEIEETDRLLSKSKLTEKDVAELAELANAGVARRWKNATRG